MIDFMSLSPELIYIQICHVMHNNAKGASHETRDIGPMLDHNRSRWPNSGPTLCQSVVFAGKTISDAS